MISSHQLRQKFLDFMTSKGHSVIPSSPLVPKEDPTVLFINSGMQPLVPYLMGVQKHPNGLRLANIQKCIRTGDIDEVGDHSHLTFFEMLGNWSIGDYFKKESISWTLEFLVSPEWLGLDINRIYVTVYRGGGDAPRDEESIEIWKEEFGKYGVNADIGIQYDFKNPENNLDKNKFIYKIMEMSVRDNWWDLPYKGPCGASTEIYYLLDKEPVDFQTSVLPNLSLEEKENYIDKNVMEIWNNVFMEYIGVREGRESEPKDLEKLENKNVDTGVGFERVLAVLNGGTNVYQTDVLAPLVAVVDKWSGS